MRLPIKKTMTALILMGGISCTLKINAQVEIEGDPQIELKMYAYSANTSRLWNMNGIMSYGFGINQDGLGAIWSDVNKPNPLLSFSDSWINGYNFRYLNIGGHAYNRIHRSQYGSAHGAFGFDFNRSSTAPGLIIENNYGEGAGIYFDYDFVAIWSPGDQNRLLRIYDEDGMVEKAYIDGDGYFHTNSDRRCKKDIDTLKNTLTKLNKLRGVEYKHSNQSRHTVPNTFEEKINGQTIYKEISIPEEKADSKKHFGFIAQEIEEIIPEVVSEDEFGNKFVNYDGVIPFLVEAIKEQQKEIAELQVQVSASVSLQQEIYELKVQLEKLRETNPDIINRLKPDTEAAKGLKLYANAPNPFKNSTDIRMDIPASILTATLSIYNLNGRLLRAVNIVSRGAVTVTIEANELTPGMYLYSLLANGQLVDTKTMVITY